MAETTTYGLQKPAGTDYYDIDVHNDNMDAIDAQMKANADAAGAAASTAAAAASAAAGAQGDADSHATRHAAAGGDPLTPAAIGAATAADVDALEAINAPLTTSGTAPAFTIAPTPAISAYADGQQWTVRFHAAGENPTLNVSGKGAATILEATGKAAKVKAGQIARVMRLGANFFTVSGGGGAALPDTILAGATPVLALFGKGGGYEVYEETGNTFIVVKSGTYRIACYIHSNISGVNGLVKYQKNGVDISGSSGTGSNNGSARVFDTTLSAGDVVKQMVGSTSGGGGWAYGTFVGIVADDLQPELNKIVTV